MKELIFKKKKCNEFDIIEKDIIKHSKILFKIIKQFYNDLDLVSELGDVKGIAKIVKRKYEDDFIFSNTAKYHEGLLKINKFRVVTVYHLCLTRLIKKRISMLDYEFFKMLVEKIMVENLEKGYLSYESLMLKKFKVDPSVLPIEHLQLINSMDEFAMASELAMDKVKFINGPDKYNTYREYYDYVFTQAKKINIELNDKGFYGTYDDENLTVNIISKVMGLPSPVSSGFYKGADETTDMPIEAKKEIQSRIFEISNKNDSPGFGL